MANSAIKRPQAASYTGNVAVGDVQAMQAAAPAATAPVAPARPARRPAARSYKVAKGDTLEFSLGYSHPVVVEVLVVWLRAGAAPNSRPRALTAPVAQARARAFR